MLAALLPCKNYFDRQASLINETLTAGWITSIVLVLIGTIWLGVFAHKHVDYTHDMWWQFELLEDAPRFLRASVGAAALLLIVGLVRLLGPADPKFHLPDDAELSPQPKSPRQSRARPPTWCCSADKSLLFNAPRTAFVMYSIEGTSWVALGDPVGPDSELPELAWRFCELCDRRAGWPVFYQIGPERLPLYLDLGLSLLKLGEDARVPLADFGLEGADRR